MNMLNNF